MKGKRFEEFELGDKMNKIINYKDIKDNYVLVDARSPSEFEECHIPSSVNIPLFDDEQRKIIGTVYKQESIEKAKVLGLEFGSKILPNIYKKILELKKQYKNVVIYCARGGMRSGAVCSLLNAIGANVWQLKEGYKGYRAVVNEELPIIHEKIDYIVIHGLTGVGKTDILQRLEEKGFDVLDLENAANNRGSLLGDVGLGGKRSQKQFESLVYEKLRKRKTDNVFIEAESRRIGNIIMPEYIPNTMKKGRHILVESSLNVRAERIVSEYIKIPNSKTELIENIKKIKRYMSGNVVDEILNMVEKEEYLEAAKELMIKYYDPMYKHTQDTYNYDLIVNSDRIEDACKDIENWAKKN